MSVTLIQTTSLVGNILAAVVLILANKRIVEFDKFKFMTVLTGLHSTFMFIATFLFIMIGLVEYKAVKRYDSLIKIAMGAVSSIIFMNFNLATNSVGFYQVSIF